MQWMQPLRQVRKLKRASHKLGISLIYGWLCLWSSYSYDRKAISLMSGARTSITLEPHQPLPTAGQQISLRVLWQVPECLTHGSKPGQEPRGSRVHPLWRMRGCLPPTGVGAQIFDRCHETTLIKIAAILSIQEKRTRPPLRWWPVVQSIFRSSQRQVP